MSNNIFNLAARITLVLAVALSGCASYRHLEPYTETVMSPGMRITATNDNGTVTVTCGKDTKRTYEGEGWKKTIKHIARKGRWRGSLGLYDPAGSFSPHGRVIVEEGRLYFLSVEDAMRYLYVGSLHSKPVYTNDGLVVGYSVARGELPRYGKVVARSVEVWQLYINGIKPTSLPGARDEAIKIEGGQSPTTSTPYPARIGRRMTLGKHPLVPLDGYQANESNHFEQLQSTLPRAGDAPDITSLELISLHGPEDMVADGFRYQLRIDRASGTAWLVKTGGFAGVEQWFGPGQLDDPIISQLLMDAEMYIK